MPGPTMQNNLALCRVVGFALASSAVLALSSQTASADDKKPQFPDVTTPQKQAPGPVPVPYPNGPLGSDPPVTEPVKVIIPPTAAHPKGTTNNSTPQGVAPAAKAGGGRHK